MHSKAATYTMKRIFSIIAAIAVAVLATGAAPARDGSMKVDEILESGEKYVGQEVSVEGLCTHICSHGGRKMFLRGARGLLRIESSDATGAFRDNVLNEPVRVTGRLRETRIDEDYLRSWEARIGRGKAIGEHDGCDTESAARGETGDTERQKIANFRKRIAERNAREGKNYLSVFHIEAESYEIL